MLMLGDFDLNSMQECSGASLNDFFRTTMLNQELVFKGQVHELHNLYRTQKTLMQNIDRKEYQRYNFSKASAQSPLSQCTNTTRDEPRGLFEGCKSLYGKIQARPSGLKPPLHSGVRHFDPAELKLSLSFQEDKRRESGAKRNQNDVGSHASSPIVIDLEDSSDTTSNERLEQSPVFTSAAPLGNSRGNVDSEASVLFHPIIASSLKNNIPFGTGECYPLSDDNGWNPFNQGLNKCSGGISINKLSTRRQQSSWHEPGLLDLNKTQFVESSCLSNDPTVVHPSTASSSYAFHGLAGKMEEGTGCFATRNKKNWLNTSEMCDGGKSPFLNSSWKTEKAECLGRGLRANEIRISETDSVSLKAVSSAKSDMSEAVVCNSNDLKNGSDGIRLKLPNSRTCSCAASKQKNLENSKEEDPAFLSSAHCHKIHNDVNGNVSYSECKPCCIGDNDSSSVKTTQPEAGNSNSDQCSATHVGSQISETLAGEQDQRKNSKEEDPAFLSSAHCHKIHNDVNGNVSYSECKPCCIGDNDSSSVKTTQPEVGNSNSDQCSATHVGSQISETLAGEQDQRSSDSSESRHKCFSKEEATEMDVLTREAAKALLGMSLESSSCSRNSAGEVGESSKIEKESEETHYSCDFFELMTLALPESSVDDYSVSETPEVNFTESKDVGLKFRRGRRLKDFQKDILPGLASLSRHEIREDMNIMEGVLRSREYKRLQAKMADGHRWCTPVRNKRSRLNHVTRRKIVL